METLGARTRQTTRRSERAGVGGAREEEEGVRIAQPRRARSSPRRSARVREEEVQSATPSSEPRPRRSLRGSRLTAGDEKDEEREPEVRSATPSSGWYPDGEEEEKEARSTQSRRGRSSCSRNTQGEEEVRRSRPGRPERSAGPHAQQYPEGVLAERYTPGQNAPGKDEAEGRGTRSSGAKFRSSQYSREEQEEVWGTRSRRSKPAARGDAKVQGAAPVSAKNSTGKNPLGEREAEPGTRSRRARSGASWHVKVLEEEKRAVGTKSRRRVASAPVKYVVRGENEDTPWPRDVTRRAGAGDEVRAGPSGHLGEKEPVRSSQRPAPISSGDAGNFALDTGHQRTMPSSRGREETLPAASSRKESRKEEKREEDEDCHMARQLLRLKDQIEQQLLEYKAEVEASKESPMEEFTEGDLLQRIDDLERKMEGVKIELETKTLALKRIQVAHALQKKLEKSDSESESILAILKNILTLNCSILKAQQQTRDLEEKMLDVKKKRLMYKKAGEEKLLEIQAENRKKKDELNLLKNSALLTKIKKSLQKEIDSTTIIQNVFQHIVMAARIDWAADPTLKALILQLEKNLSFI